MKYQKNENIATTAEMKPKWSRCPVTVGLPIHTGTRAGQAEQQTISSGTQMDPANFAKFLENASKNPNVAAMPSWFNSVWKYGN